MSSSDSDVFDICLSPWGSLSVHFSLQVQTWGAQQITCSLQETELISSPRYTGSRDVWQELERQDLLLMAISAFKATDGESQRVGTEGTKGDGWPTDGRKADVGCQLDWCLATFNFTGSRITPWSPLTPCSWPQTHIPTGPRSTRHHLKLSDETRAMEQALPGSASHFSPPSLPSRAIHTLLAMQRETPVIKKAGYAHKY